MSGPSLRVAVVEPIGRGGLIHYAFQLCRGLVEVGVEPILVTSTNYELGEMQHPFERHELLRLWDPKPVVEPAPNHSAARRRLRRLLRAAVWYREWGRLIAFLRRLRPDLIQFGDVRFGTDLIPMMALHRLGIPLVDLCHNLKPLSLSAAAGGRFGEGRLHRSLMRRVYRLQQRVMVHHEINRQRFLKLYELEPERVVAIPHGNQEVFLELADAACTGSELRRRLRLDGRRPVVLQFGALGRYKGIDQLIETWPRVLSDHPAAVLVIVGYPLPGFALEQTEQRITQLGLEESVRLLPRYVPTPEVAAWFGTASVVVLPYRQGYASGVLHLALTCGRPVVVSRVGGLAETVEDGVTGRVVEPDRPDQLGDAIGALLNDPDAAERLGRAAAARERQRFAWPRIAEQIRDEVYRPLLGAVAL